VRGLSGRTLGESAAALAGKLPVGLEPTPGPFRLEAIDRSGRVVALLAEYESADVALGRVIDGDVLRLVPARRGFSVVAAGAPGAPPAARLADGDRDGLPDFVDNCLATANADRATATATASRRLRRPRSGPVVDEHDVAAQRCLGLTSAPSWRRTPARAGAVDQALGCRACAHATSTATALRRARPRARVAPWPPVGPSGLLATTR
jgi:hypothetical protein